MQRSEFSLLGALGALALFVGAQAYQQAHPRRTASESSGSVAGSIGRGLKKERITTRGARETERDHMHAVAVELSTARRLDRDEVRRRLQEGEAGTYMGELLLDRDSSLTRWPDRSERPLRVWIGNGAGKPGWQDEYREQVRQAFESWENSGIPVRFDFVPDSATADVHVTWIDRFTDPISGKTLWSRDDRWWIVDADITLALHHRDGDPLDAAQTRAIALHEIGHLLGLDHTGDAANIMAPKVRVRDLSTADRATVRLLYSVPAGRVR
ncbi:matrixin family metalloprotease [Roseisolibacter sp. H3M3-2]|uniref:matrixin family metalloprotease n=1 Tax=Roseisolibacter sp. H3M3-2 TaxID=3031323 RepID=UPI0023D9DF00|nr:matrixin family metalloprotease [Roseisolibacter sp. H3M3-2]MDF1505226.1 matrixin family metalloprotease [Roseisolibacter sp. H3M3-2]